MASWHGAPNSMTVQQQDAPPEEGAWSYAFFQTDDGPGSALLTELEEDPLLSDSEQQCLPATAYEWDPLEELLQEDAVSDDWLNHEHDLSLQEQLQVHGTSTRVAALFAHASDAAGQTDKQLSAADDTPTAATCTAASAATMAPITTSASEASAEPVGPEAMTMANVPGGVMDGQHQLAAAAAVQAVARSRTVAGTANISQATFCSIPADPGLFACDPTASTATCTHNDNAHRSWPVVANTPEGLQVTDAVEGIEVAGPHASLSWSLLAGSWRRAITRPSHRPLQEMRFEPEVLSYCVRAGPPMAVAGATAFQAQPGNSSGCALAECLGPPSGRKRVAGPTSVLHFKAAPPDVAEALLGEAAAAAHSTTDPAATQEQWHPFTCRQPVVLLEQGHSLASADICSSRTSPQPHRTVQLKPRAGPATEQSQTTEPMGVSPACSAQTTLLQPCSLLQTALQLPHTQQRPAAAQHTANTLSANKTGLDALTAAVPSRRRVLPLAVAAAGRDQAPAKAGPCKPLAASSECAARPHCATRQKQQDLAEDELWTAAALSRQKEIAEKHRSSSPWSSVAWTSAAEQMAATSKVLKLQQEVKKLCALTAALQQDVLTARQEAADAVLNWEQTKQQLEQKEQMLQAVQLKLAPASSATSNSKGELQRVHRQSDGLLLAELPNTESTQLCRQQAAEILEARQRLQDVQQQQLNTQQQLQEAQQQLQETQQQLQQHKNHLHDTQLRLQEACQELQDNKTQLTDSKQELAVARVKANVLLTVQQHRDALQQENSQLKHSLQAAQLAKSTLQLLAQATSSVCSHDPAHTPAEDQHAAQGAVQGAAGATQAAGSMQHQPAKVQPSDAFKGLRARLISTGTLMKRLQHDLVATADVCAMPAHPDTGKEVVTALQATEVRLLKHHQGLWRDSARLSQALLQPPLSQNQSNSLQECSLLLPQATSNSWLGASAALQYTALAINERMAALLGDFEGLGQNAAQCKPQNSTAPDF